MFESAELGHTLDKAAYEKEVPKLRSQLLAAQTRTFDLGDFPVVLLSGGVDGGGKGDVVNLLLEWMDPRHIQVHAMGPPSDEECSRPPMWRFWRALPRKGKTGVFFGSWYTAAIVDRVLRRSGGAQLARRLSEISRFERMLADEGALIVKLWQHLSKKDQKRRFRKLESDPRTAWRVTRQDWENHARYDRFRDVSERVLRETSTADAPWHVIPAADPRYRNLAVARTLLDAMNKRLEREERTTVTRAPPRESLRLDQKNLIGELDLKLSLTEAEYHKQLGKLQGRLNQLASDKRFRDAGCVLVFEGNDAAGKGGAIRRVTQALDARQYDVVPIAAPTEEERAQPYLWRFWRHVPRKGHFSIFDRSWYGRVLVERVEGLTPETDWMRGYREIVDFEDSLSRFGIVVVKLWLAISKEEQLRRFKAREKTAFKRFKITKEDWRNRGKWRAYEHAVCDMVDRTSTEPAPWHLIEANDKKWARVKILAAVCDSIEKRL